MHPPRDIKSSPEEIAAASLPEFMAMIGKQDLLIGGKHARKKIIKHMHPERGQTHALTMQLDSERFEGCEVLAWPTQGSSSELDALALHHLSLSEHGETQLSSGASALKGGGALVLHDLIWRQEPSAELLASLNAVWKCPCQPKTVPQLWAQLEGLGLESISLDIGAFAWFRPKQFARDEGKYAADILFNALNHPVARSRYLAALDHFREFERYYGYVVISGVRRKE